MSNTQSSELTEFEVQLLTFLDQQYHLTGTLLTAEKAYEEYGIPVKDFERAFNNPTFRDSLSERGVVFERLTAYEDNAKWIGKSLTPIQLLAANALLDLTDTRTNKKKLQDLGISTTKYNAWLKDPVFKDYLAARAKQLIGDNEHEVDLALLDRVRAGDMKAISYYNEFTGRYTPASSRQSSSAGNIDIQAILVRVIEIINEEVNNPEEILAISTRLRSLIGANNIANALMLGEDDPIEIPEVVETRIIPKELANGNL